MVRAIRAFAWLWRKTIPLADLITSLEEAQAFGRLQARLKVLTHPGLLVVDEIGYLPISRTGAMLLFQLMTRRYEQDPGGSGTGPQPTPACASGGGDELSLSPRRTVRFSTGGIVRFWPGVDTRYRGRR